MPANLVSVGSKSIAPIAIGCFMDKTPDSQTVQESVQSYYDYMMEKLLEEDDTEDMDEYTEKDVANLLQESTQEMFKDEEILEMITSQCGDEAADFIGKELQVYIDKASNDLLGDCETRE
jgi:hypothetical protein